MAQGGASAEEIELAAADLEVQLDEDFGEAVEVAIKWLEEVESKIEKDRKAAKRAKPKDRKGDVIGEATDWLDRKGAALRRKLGKILGDDPAAALAERFIDGIKAGMEGDKPGPFDDIPPLSPERLRAAEREANPGPFDDIPPLSPERLQKAKREEAASKKAPRFPSRGGGR